MPLFHFQVAGGGKTLHPAALEFPDLRSAQNHAQRLAGGLTALNNDFGGGDRLRDWHVAISDKNGRTLARYDLCKAPQFGNSPGRSNVQRRLRA